MLHRGSTPRGIAVVNGEVEVISPDSIDGAVQLADRRLYRERGAAPTQIPQQKGHAEPGRKIVARGGGVERALRLGDLHDERLDGPEGHDNLSRSRVDEVSREPVAAERTHAHSMHSAIVGAQSEDAAGRIALAENDGHPAAQFESPESQAFLLLLQIELLRMQFVLKLPGEVVEEMVPAHAVTVAIAPDNR